MKKNIRILFVIFIPILYFIFLYNFTKDINLIISNLFTILSIYITAIYFTETIKEKNKQDFINNIYYKLSDLFLEKNLTKEEINFKQSDFVLLNKKIDEEKDRYLKNILRMKYFLLSKIAKNFFNIFDAYLINNEIKEYKDLILLTNHKIFKNFMISYPFLTEYLFYKAKEIHFVNKKTIIEYIENEIYRKNLTE